MEYGTYKSIQSSSFHLEFLLHQESVEICKIYDLVPLVAWPGNWKKHCPELLMIRNILLSHILYEFLKKMKKYIMCMIYSRDTD